VFITNRLVTRFTFVKIPQLVPLYLTDLHTAPHLITLVFFFQKTNLYFTNFPLTVTKQELFDLFVAKINVKTLLEFRIDNAYGVITFINFHSMRHAMTAFASEYFCDGSARFDSSQLTDITIGGLRMRFRSEPFLTNPTDPTT
jgi:hypothetical protein